MNFRRFPSHLKNSGNLNRIHELVDNGCDAAEIQQCFAEGGMHLKCVAGDFPMLANWAEMTRKALPKRVVKEFLAKRAADDDFAMA